MNWYLEALNKYAVFDGRARRKEYWFFMLFNFLISMAVGIFDRLMGSFDPHSGAGFFGLIYMLGIMIPGLAVSVRRLHDSGRSGWWLLLSLVPVLGGIVLLYFMVLDSDEGINKYGPSPKDNPTELFR
ncbi:MAG: DUF805 domain-containing protein [Methylococcaceae bacterium]